MVSLGFFMHTGTQRKHVIKPINRFADGCPAQRVVEKVVLLFEITRAPRGGMSAEADGADCERRDVYGTEQKNWIKK